MSDWQYLTPYNIGQPGSNVRANGGAGAQALTFRSALDAARTPMGQRVPAAEYPDGYLGTIQSRREDRLLNSLKNRLNQRSYQRGVHKGERIDPADYFWPEELRPTSALEYQARGVKWTQRGNPVEHLVNGGTTAFTSPAELAALQQQVGLRNPGLEYIDPIRAERQRRLLPGWR
jgi:hypothetical protein